MPRLLRSLALLLGLVAALHSRAGEITVAAAADLQSALQEVAASFRAAHPADKVELVFGASGKLAAQLRNGAPFDLFFSADIAYPRQLQAQGIAASAPKLYAVGHLVLWSLKPELARLPLKELPNSPLLRKLAIANPEHSPYGRSAKEALGHEGVWDAMAPKLVLGENIAHAAQFVDSGAADAGIVALSLVLSPALAGKGAWTPIPADWHAPMEQGFIVTKRAKSNPLAASFSAHMDAPATRQIMKRYGFEK
ncbi:MAG TPA: molybdate ABC transporter substrate-binding protein [Burkholderiaceae bacterium]|nr:molybdate ABC transporter substrate-binding protein [Burkholderiaceae bacterium]